MAKLSTFAFVSDATVFGGHEVMAIEGARGLLEAGHSIAILGNRNNRRLWSEAKSIDAKLVPWSIEFNTIQSFVPQLFASKTNEAVTAIESVRPDAVILLQGRIESSRVPLFAARKLGLPVVSYLPFAHRATLTSKHHLHGLVRDLTNYPAYKSIRNFVTCYEGARADILRWAPHSNVEVVPNPMPPGCAADRVSAKVKIGLPVDRKIISIIGRVEVRQKGHDLVVSELSSIFAKVPGALLLVVGDGPDLVGMQQLALQTGNAENVMFVGWQKRPRDYLEASDCLIVPSRFEGMPLVMLDAISVGVPVAAANVDGMAEVLPFDCLFDRSGDAIGRAIRSAMDMPADHWAKLKNDLSRRTVKEFRRAFASAVDRLLSQ